MQNINLAAVRGTAVAKIWDIVLDFVTGYDGKGACKKMPHTLLKVTHSFISLFKNVHV